MLSSDVQKDLPSSLVRKMLSAAYQSQISGNPDF